MAAKPPNSVRITRRFDASPERVFDAWLDPKIARTPKHPQKQGERGCVTTVLRQLSHNFPRGLLHAMHEVMPKQCCHSRHSRYSRRGATSAPSGTWSAATICQIIPLDCS